MYFNVIRLHSLAMGHRLQNDASVDIFKGRCTVDYVLTCRTSRVLTGIYFQEPEKVLEQVTILRMSALNALKKSYFSQYLMW